LVSYWRRDTMVSINTGSYWVVWPTCIVRKGPGREGSVPLLAVCLFVSQFVAKFLMHSREVKSIPIAADRPTPRNLDPMWCLGKCARWSWLAGLWYQHFWLQSQLSSSHGSNRCRRHHSHVVCHHPATGSLPYSFATSTRTSKIETWRVTTRLLPRSATASSTSPTAALQVACFIARAVRRRRDLARG